MPYVHRGSDGRISAVSLTAAEGMQEFVTDDNTELLRFTRDLTGGRSSLMLESDLKLIRVLEDLLDVLLNQGVIRFTDLPEAAQEKLMERRNLRVEPHSLNLLGDGAF